MMAQSGIIFLDTETTGLGDVAEIVDIAIVSREGRVLLDTRIRPQGPIPLDVRQIHGLDEAVLADAPTWPEVYPLVGRILDTHRPVVVYNAEFDQRIINQVNRRHNLPAFQTDWQCAMKRFAEFAGIWHQTYGGYRWHKLADALRMVNRTSSGPQHRALNDAESCRQIVIAMATEAEQLQLAGQPTDQERERREQESDPVVSEYGGGQVTVFSVNRGCSRAIPLILVGVLALCLLMAACALVVTWLRWVS